MEGSSEAAETQGSSAMEEKEEEGSSTVVEAQGGGDRWGSSVHVLVERGVTQGSD